MRFNSHQLYFHCTYTTDKIRKRVVWRADATVHGLRPADVLDTGALDSSIEEPSMGEQ